MVKVSPKIYRKYVIVSSKGELILYVQILKVLYGLLQIALLFYSNFVKDLESYVFHINQYDPFK